MDRVSAHARTARGDALTVEAPNMFHRNWVQQHFLDRIRSTATHVAGHPVPVSLSVAVGRGGYARPGADAVGVTDSVIRKSADAGHAAFSFETFVVGPCNELAHAGRQSRRRRIPAAPTIRSSSTAASDWARRISCMRSRTRCGRRFRSYRVLSIGAELFINEMVSAVRRQQMETFHHRFRKIDTLVVDDVQFIAGKERTQEEFLHTFNLLCAAGKQIVVSSDKPPREIAESRGRTAQPLRGRPDGRDDASRSRYAPAHPRREGCAAGARSLGRRARLSRPTGCGRSSVRELEGALTRLKAMASLGGRTIDLALAEETVGPLYPIVRERVPVERVEVARDGGARTSSGRPCSSAQRNARLVFARQVSMYLMRKQIGLSLATIGERYGRDHTTVLHAVRAIEARRACDPEVRRLVTTLEERL